MRIFGREPVYIMAIVAIALKLASAYGLGVTEAQQTLINVFLSCGVAAASAWVLRDGALGAAILQLASAGLALFLGFGLEMSAEQQAGWMALVAAAIALFEHREVTPPVSSVPLEESGPSLEGGATPPPPVSLVTEKDS